MALFREKYTVDGLTQTLVYKKKEYTRYLVADGITYKSKGENKGLSFEAQMKYNRVDTEQLASILSEYGVTINEIGLRPSVLNKVLRVLDTIEEEEITNGL